MNRIVLCLCLVLAMVAGLGAPAVAAQGALNGVLVQERVVNLPQDQGKWYISVVGDANDARYRTVLSWFDTHENLKHLKDQVHFCPVKSNTAIYKKRYAQNVKGLPTVRVQNSKGVVIYEVAGLAIPLTPDALYAAIANDVQVAQGCRPILPWRREMERRCRPCPQPNPQPEPDPGPQPLPPSPPGPPDIVKPTQSVLPPWWAMLLALVGGSAVGVVQKWHDTYAQK